MDLMVEQIYQVHEIKHELRVCYEELLDDFNYTYRKGHSFDDAPLDTGRKSNLHITFRRRPGRLLNVLCTFNLCPVSRGTGAETCYKNWGMKIEKWGTKRFPTDFSKFSEQLFSNFSVSFCFNSRLILKELWICILHIIHVRSLFCSINLHFLPVLFENPLFCFSVISVFSVCSSCHLFRRYNIFVIINYISAECSMIFFSFQKYSLFRPI